MSTNGKEEIIGEVVTDLATIPNALPGIVRAEVDMQIATAKNYPRSITNFKREALSLATLDQETATSCYYVLPRGGEKIMGESIRLAEIAASAFGNLQYGGRVVEVGAAHVTAQGFAWDLEKNNRVVIEVRRKIIDKHGKRYNEDMITLTGNAAVAIAIRNAVLKVIPKALLKDIYEECKRVSVGKGLTIEQQRMKAFEAFEKTWKLKEPQVLMILKKKGMDDVSVEDLIDLRGIYTALQDKMMTVEELLAADEPAEEAKKQTKTEAVKEAVAQKRKAKAAIAEPEKPEEKPKENEVRGVPLYLMSGQIAGKPIKKLMFDASTAYVTDNEQFFKFMEDAQEQKWEVAVAWKESELLGKEITNMAKVK